MQIFLGSGVWKLGYSAISSNRDVHNINTDPNLNPNPKHLPKLCNWHIRNITTTSY